MVMSREDMFLFLLFLLLLLLLEEEEEDRECFRPPMKRFRLRLLMSIFNYLSTVVSLRML